jgi:hypothetical protein
MRPRTFRVGPADNNELLTTEVFDLRDRPLLPCAYGPASFKRACAAPARGAHRPKNTKSKNQVRGSDATSN